MSDKIPAGYYQGRAIAGSEQYGFTKKGDEQIVLDLSIPSLERQVSTVLFFSDKAYTYSLERLRACGWTGDDVTQLVGIDANEITVEITYEVYEGKERMKVNIATGGGRIKLETPMDAAAKRGFAARMKALAKGGAPAPRPQAARPAPAQTGGGLVDPGSPDDEIPF